MRTHMRTTGRPQVLNKGREGGLKSARAQSTKKSKSVTTSTIRAERSIYDCVSSAATLSFIVYTFFPLSHIILIVPSTHIIVPVLCCLYTSMPSSLPSADVSVIVLCVVVLNLLSLFSLSSLSLFSSPRHFSLWATSPPRPAAEGTGVEPTENTEEEELFVPCAVVVVRRGGPASTEGRCRSFVRSTERRGGNENHTTQKRDTHVRTMIGSVQSLVV